MMAQDNAKLAAMHDFVLSSASNLQTALLIHDTINRVQKTLVSDFAIQLEQKLMAVADWQVTNSLAEFPTAQHSELKWSPPEWSETSWGVALSAQTQGPSQMIFGLCAPSNNAPNRGYYRAMPDQDRLMLGAAIRTALTGVNQTVRETAWWPAYVELPTVIKDWRDHTALRKIASLRFEGGQPDLIAGKTVSEFLFDAFRTVQQIIVPIMASRTIEPVPE
jgi:hypothetical protein